MRCVSECPLDWYSVGEWREEGPRKIEQLIATIDWIQIDSRFVRDLD